MVESFKITAEKLKRILKIHVNLPNSYIECDNTYPCIIALDGQLYYNFINEDTKKINTNEIIEKSNKEFILIALHSPKLPAWRMSELNPYYNGDDKTVEPILSYIYFDYIVTELLPLLKERYRINDELYLLGYKEGCIGALYMTYRYHDFKGAGLFSPTFNLAKDKLLVDLYKNFSADKKIYIYHGEIGDSTDNSIYYISGEIKKLNPNLFNLDIRVDKDNSYSALEDGLIDFINYML